MPNEGPMTDPAHPAIYPTGVAPRQKLSGLEFKVRSYSEEILAAFGDPAISRHINVTIDVGGYVFKAGGMTLTYEGWSSTSLMSGLISASFQSPQGDVLKNVGVEMEEKFTQPSYRYNQASMLAKMEQEKIGTKATRG